MPPSPPSYNDTGIQYHTIETFTFLSGTTLHNLRVAYRSHNPDSTLGTVLVPTCFAGRINTTLSFNTAPCKSLADYHVVVVAMLGNGESSSPSNKAFFPAPGELHYEDVIKAHHHLLTEGLGVKELEAVVGFSMGGQQAYHWAVMYPSFVKRIVGICTSARCSGHNWAFLEGPITAMTSSIDYIAWKQIQSKIANGDEVGEHLREVRPKKGLAAWARTYAAWLTSPPWFRERGWEKQECETLEEWMLLREAGYQDWGADDLLVKARMWQMGNVGKTKKGEVSELKGKMGSDEEVWEALKSVEAKVLLMPCRTDQYFPPEDNEREIEQLRDGRVEVIESTWGHTAGGGANPTDVEFMDARIAEHMKR